MSEGQAQPTEVASDVVVARTPEEIGIVHARSSHAKITVFVLKHLPHVVVDVDFECGTDFFRLTLDQARALAGLLLEPAPSMDSPGRELRTVSGATAKAVALEGAYEPLTGLVLDFYPKPHASRRRYTPTLRCVVLSPSEVRTLVALLREAANARTLL